ncbi:MAG: hypothetical protein ACI9HK_005691, partial [Pirellulaceae bacterium]
GSLACVRRNNTDMMTIEESIRKMYSGGVGREGKPSKLLHPVVG